MKLVLTEKAASLLWQVVVQPNTLNTALCLGNPTFKHYVAGDVPAMKQVASLQKWVREKVGVEDSKTGQVTFEDVTVGLKQTYVDRVLAMLEHYKDLGKTPLYVQPYLELEAALKGEAFEADDPSEDVSAEEVEKG